MQRRREWLQGWENRRIDRGFKEGPSWERDLAADITEYDEKVKRIKAREEADLEKATRESRAEAEAQIRRSLYDSTEASSSGTSRPLGSSTSQPVDLSTSGPSDSNNTAEGSEQRVPETQAQPQMDWESSEATTSQNKGKGRAVEDFIESPNKRRRFK